MEGPDDYEVLFLRRGRLIYLLTNPTPSGVEGTSGGLYESNAAVNNNTWVRVSGLDSLEESIQVVRGQRKSRWTRGIVVDRLEESG